MTKGVDRVKAFLSFFLLAAIQSCGHEPASPTASAPPDTFLTTAFAQAEQKALTYDASGQWLQQVTLVFDAVDDPQALRLAIQAQLIDHLTQKGHPEGSCVQVKHLRRVSQDIFEVLVVCVG